MSETLYGYARVSSQDQNEERQIKALINEGVERNNIITDKQSGKNFDRPGYRRLLRKLHTHDTLVIQSIDRLGRNYQEIIKQWKHLTHTKGVYIVVLDMPLLNTRNTRDLTGTLISDIVLELLSYVAETERAFLRKRVKEGMAIAKSNGIHCGRPPMEIPEAFEDVYDQWKSKKMSAVQASRALGVSRSTFMKWVSER